VKSSFSNRSNREKPLLFPFFTPNLKEEETREGGEEEQMIYITSPIDATFQLKEREERERERGE
jgi:hypothetical protein